MSNSGSQGRNKNNVRARSPVPLERCGMAQAADLLGDRWSLLILREGFYGVVRFADIQADIGAPRSILTNRLNKLLEAGLLKKFEYQETSSRARYAYSLTERGRELAIVFLAMKQWWDNGQNEPPSVSFAATDSNADVHVAILDSEGKEVALNKLQVKMNK